MKKENEKSMKSNRIGTIVRIVGIVILTIGVLSLTGAVSATQQYLDVYNKVYGEYGTGTCGVCHVNSNGGGTLNQYGTTFQSQSNHVTNPEDALKAISYNTEFTVRSEVFVNIYMDNYQGFYKVEPFYIDYKNSARVPVVDAVTGNTKNLVIERKVILEWVNTGQVPLTIEFTDKISGNVLYYEQVKPGYEVTYTLDTAGIYEARIVEYVGMDGNIEKQNIVSSLKGEVVVTPQPPVVVATTIPTVVVTPVVTYQPANYGKPTNITHIGPIITPNPVVTAYPIATYAPTSEMVQTFGEGIGIFFKWMGQGIWKGLNS